MIDRAWTRVRTWWDGLSRQRRLLLAAGGLAALLLAVAALA